MQNEKPGFLYNIPKANWELNLASIAYIEILNIWIALIEGEYDGISILLICFPNSW